MSWTDTLLKVAFVVGGAGARPDVYRNVMGSVLEMKRQQQRREMFEKTLEEQKRQFDEQMGLERERFDWEKEQLEKTQKSLSQLFLNFLKPQEDFKAELSKKIDKLNKLQQKLIEIQKQKATEGMTSVPQLEERQFNILANDREAQKTMENIMGQEQKQTPSYDFDVRRGAPNVSIPETKASPETFVWLWRTYQDLIKRGKPYYTGPTQSIIGRFFNE